MNGLSYTNKPSLKKDQYAFALKKWIKVVIFLQGIHTNNFFNTGGYQKEGIVIILNRKHSRSNKKTNISFIFIFQHIFSLYHLQIIEAQTTLTYLDKASFTRHDYTLVGISNWSINLDQRLPNHPSYSQSRHSSNHIPLLASRPWGPRRLSHQPSDHEWRVILQYLDGVYPHHILTPLYLPLTQIHHSCQVKGLHS